MTTQAEFKRLQEIAAEFKRDMEKLGLGVSISVAGGPYVEVVPPPAETKESK